MLKTRECRLCGNEFKTKRGLWRCKSCVNKVAAERRREKIEELKEQGLYRGMVGRPSDMEKGYQERASEWRLKRKHLDTLYYRGEWQEYFRNEFDRIEKDEALWKNINRETLAEDIRGANSIKKQRGVIGRPKHDSKLYPDTRNLNIDDISQYRLDED